MGINDNLVEDYRNVISEALLSSETIVDIVGNGKYSIEEKEYTTLPAEQLLWKNIIPQQFLPSTYTEAETYIFYDMDETVYTSIKKTGYVELTVYFWICTNKKTVIKDGKLKNDLIVREIKRIFSEQRNLGISKNQLLYNDIFTTGSNDFSSRIIAFKVTDWSDKIRYGT